MTRSIATPKKENFSVRLPESLIDRARNAVYWTPGLTLAGLVEEALQEKLDRLERKRSEPFPQRREELKAGRPIR